MRIWQSDNRKLWGWLLALALLVMTLPSGASWQCLNGTPCPANCPMLKSSTKASVQNCAAPAASAHCSHCSAASPAARVTGNQHRVACTTPVCVLRYSSQPTISLTNKQILTLPLLALPPPSPVAAAPVKAASVPVPTTLSFYPQRFLRPTSGRAPPVWLA
jgi:hypothetical protein